MESKRFTMTHIKDGKIVTTYFESINRRKDIRAKVKEHTNLDIDDPYQCYQVAVVCIGESGYIYN